METVFISTSKLGRARSDYFLALAESFSKDGYRVIVIISGSPKILPTHDGIIFFKWPNKRPTKLRDFVFLLKLIKLYKPRVLISSFGSVNIMNLCGSISGIRNRINYVLSISDLFEIDAQKNSWLKFKILKYRKRRIYKFANLLVANSQGVAIDLKSYYSLNHSNIFVLPNLIIKTQIPYHKQGQRKQQLLIVGNLIPLKGHAILLKQFKKTVKVFPNLKLLIIGLGPEKENLFSETAKLGLGEKVQFLNYVPNDEIGEYFAKSLIHVSASFNEAFGFVNIEAMREGTPIIVTKSAGGMDIIKENINGCFLDLNDEDSLTDSVRQIFDKWTVFSAAARKDFMENYELDSEIENHRELLKARFK